MSKKTEEVRALEISYKQGVIALFEDLFHLVTSAKAGEKRGVSAMACAVFSTPRLDTLLADREAFMNAREELENFCDDLGALTAAEAEIAALRRKYAALCKENNELKAKLAAPGISLSQEEAEVMQSALSFYRGHCDLYASNDEAEATHFPRRAESLKESAAEYRRKVALCDQLDTKITAL